MIGRQLPFLALMLPFYVVAMYAGWRSLKALWPVLLVAGGSFGLGQFLASNYIGYELTTSYSGTNTTNNVQLVGDLVVTDPAELATLTLDTAAPVATPSNRASTARMRGSLSRADRKSVV